MKAAIALLADTHVQNVTRTMVMEIFRFGRVEFFGSLLPAHVSLKQPFAFEDLEALEAWLESFSRRISPFCIELDQIYYDEWDQTAIVGLAVCETPILRALHDQINLELKNVVMDPSAAHDGDEYLFHLTAELGNIEQANPFKQYYDSLPQKQVELSFRAESIVLFLYADGVMRPGSFLCHKVLPLTGMGNSIVSVSAVIPLEMKAVSHDEPNRL